MRGHLTLGRWGEKNAPHGSCILEYFLADDFGNVQTIFPPSRRSFTHGYGWGGWYVYIHGYKYERPTLEQLLRDMSTVFNITGLIDMIKI